MTIHMIAFCLFGLAILILMGGAIKYAIYGNFNHSYTTWVYYFLIVLIFISNMLMLHIFNNLVD